MRHRFRSFIAVPVALAALAGGGCQAHWPPWESPPPGGSWVVDVGMSPSSRSGSDVQDANLAAVLHRAANDGARLLVNPIGERAAAGKPVDVDFKLSGDAASNGHAAHDQHAYQMGRAQAAVRKLLAGPTPRYANDVLAALADAGAQLQNIAGSGPRHLVVLDDLRQMGSGCNFYRDHLTPDYIRRAVRGLSAEIPDLTGVTVVFAGAGVTHKGAAFDWKREHDIESFWRAWAQAAHAEKVVYSVSPQL